MLTKSWFVVDLLFGFIFGFILLYFFKRMKYFLNFFSLKIYPITEEEKLCSIKSFDQSKTWIYELRDEIYDAHQFLFSMTNICLIEINNNLLFVFQPSNEPNHKLTDDELYANVIFNQVRIYNLTNANIGLLPMDMKRSKYWSKKSPIVLQNILHIRTEFIETSSANLSISTNENNEINLQKTLFLFTRTRRSKEEWFYRFVNASQLDLWRKEIRYQLEQDNTTQMISTKSSKRKKNVSMINNDREHKKSMISFLKRTDRFAAPDQLPYFKPVDVKQKFLPNLKQTKKNNSRQQSFDFHQRNKYNKEIRSLSSHKQQYCERWLMEQNQMNISSIDEATNDNSKKSQSHRDIIANHTQHESKQTNSNEYQHQTHSLLFFVLKYLHKLLHNTKENNIDNSLLLLNIFAARCFLDVFDHDQYLRQMRSFLQKQLRKIKIPFIEHISITSLNLGDRLPEIKDIFKPWIDEHGLWSHIKISYDGKLQLTLNAQLKWIRKKNRSFDQISHRNSTLFNSKRSVKKETNIPIKKSWRKRLWPSIHWFQHRQSNKININVTENTTKPETHPTSSLEKMTPKIRKTTIVIKLDVNNLNGILLFNIPPVPSDRLWISFLNMPAMEFSATPHLGEYRVPFYSIKDKLERKLRQLFSRYLVMPNMKDFLIPTINDYLFDNDIIQVISSNRKENNQ